MPQILSSPLFIRKELSSDGSPSVLWNLPEREDAPLREMYAEFPILSAVRTLALGVWRNFLISDNLLVMGIA